MIIEEKVEILKALADKNRLLILEMLSCGEMCGCDIMEGLNLTQPTISHHMKILQQCKLVDARKEGKWIFYTINYKVVEDLQKFINDLISFKSQEDCICKNLIKDFKKCNYHE